MLLIIFAISWFCTQHIIFIEGYAFEKYYNAVAFVDFYKNVSLSPGTYNNIFLLNKIFEGLDSKSNVSSTCLQELYTFRESSLNSSEIWPLMMLDASGGFHAGIFQGNLFHFGDWSQCIAVESPYLRTAACQAIISLPHGQAQNSSYIHHNVPFIFNLCLPSQCCEQDLEMLLLKSFRPQNISVKFECHSKQDISYSYLIIIVVMFTLILAGSSIYDLSYTRSGNKLSLWNAFALQRNWKALFSNFSSDGTLTCIFGLKFITQFTVIWYHLVMQNMSLYQPFINKFTFSEVVKSWKGVYYIALTLSVDTYLVMSGVLVSYTTVGKTSKYKNLFQYYLHRYIRLTPSLVAVVLVYLLALDLVCFGPQCKGIMSERKSCQEYWWTNVLYMNNYYPSFKQSCLRQSWYLALDWQLYLLSPALLCFTTVSRKRSLMYGGLGMMLLVSALLPSVYTYMYSLPTEEFHLDNEEEIVNYYGKFYTPLETRFGPWLIGFTVGLMIKLDELRSLHTNSWLKGTGWLLSGVIMASCLIFNVPSLQTQKKYIVLNVLSNALKKNLWGLCIGWIILACSQGFAGPLNVFLSWKPFEPLSKLCYGAYLIHRVVVGIFLLNTGAPIYYSFLNQMLTLTGVVVVTLVVSLILFLSVEAPFCNLDRLLLSRTKSSKS